ncbi:MAG TPA: hypothetical protein VJQ06_10285 [Rhizomicrobium sp.]|nr:hypothetical protein [Rhizomicrobium sp.]
MVKLPRTPSGWNDQSAAAPQETPPLSDLNNGPRGLLDGWQSPAWSLENSGLNLVLHPQTIAQIDFGDRQGPHAVQAMAGHTTGSMATGNMAAGNLTAGADPAQARSAGHDNYNSAVFMTLPEAQLPSVISGANVNSRNKSAAPPAAARPAPRDGLALDANGNVMVEQVEVTPRVNTQRLAKIIGMGEGNYESYNTGTWRVPDERVGHSYLNPPPGTVTGRTINQVLSTESLPGTDPNRMFAVGAYQISIPTLKDAVRAMKLTGDEKLTPQMQDRILAEFLIPQAGDGSLDNLLNRGEGTVDQAQNAASRKWASVAVPAGYPTRDRGISDGTMSYYADPANRASMDTTRALREFLTDLAR